MVGQVATHAARPSVARVWNEENLAAIRIDRPNPPVHARNLFHVAVAMYDAWAAYETTPVGYLHRERVTAEDLLADRQATTEASLLAFRALADAGDRRARGVVKRLERYQTSRGYLLITDAQREAARHESISYAAYRILANRFANSVSAPTILARLGKRMHGFGYDPEFVDTTGGSPAALGNRIAASIVAWGMQDGSNQAGGYADPSYTNPQPPMVVLRMGVPQGGGVPDGTDPNLWQPLSFDDAETQNDLPAELVQKFIGVSWLNTAAFALTRNDPTQPWIDMGGPSRLGTDSDTGYKQAAIDVLISSARLGSQEVVDISPGAFGNNSLGDNDGTGYPLNPITSKPYKKNLVPLGDFARVLAEYWADGPDSETPPGHWHKLANQISDSPRMVRRIGGQGPEVSRLEWDIKLYLALAGGMHDAACAAWSMKRVYEGPRPITMIRYLGSNGQCSDPSLPSYHPAGLPLEPGVSELITTESSSPGSRHFGIGLPGEIAVFSWPGEPADRVSQTSTVRWMRAKDWLPYQRETFNTPAFPGYVSGHSTFSRAGAEVLAAFTGSPFFPRGLGTFIARKNKYLKFEKGPSKTVVLQWATFYDAADQAGISRVFGGIHPPEDDFPGRVAGAQAGIQAWELASKLWDGSILQE